MKKKKKIVYLNSKKMKLGKEVSKEGFTNFGVFAFCGDF